MVTDGAVVGLVAVGQGADVTGRLLGRRRGTGIERGVGGRGLPGRVGGRTGHDGRGRATGRTDGSLHHVEDVEIVPVALVVTRAENDGAVQLTEMVELTGLPTTTVG